MKANNTKGLDVAELQRQVNDSQEQLFRLRFQMGMGQTEGLKKYRVLKKDRARLLTVLREKEIAGEIIPPPVTAKAIAVKAPAAKKKSPK